jgi:hypothetical protein
LGKRFIKFSKMQDKQELFEDSENKVEGFLTDLAVYTYHQNRTF